MSAAVNPLDSDEVYTYDPLGNRLTAAGVPGTWSYNANNELEGYGNVAFTYDDNGNTTRKTVGVAETNYSYDVEDRLVEVQDGLGGEIATYYYDPFGRRLYKEVDGQRTYFVYSNEGLIGEYHESGAEIRAYGWMPDSQWSTDPLFYKQQGQYYWYQNDHLGTPQKIIATSGRVVWSAVYDSFGNCQVQTAEIVNNLRFAGQYYDSETELYYNLNRYYDPTIGRYLRTDPYGDGLNLYAYVFNNPVNLIDPLGLCAVDWTKDKIKKGIDWTRDKITDAIRYGYDKYQKIKKYLYNEYLNALEYYKQDLLRFKDNLHYIKDKGLITFGGNQTPEEFKEARARTRQLIEMLDVATQGLDKVTVAFDAAGALATFVDIVESDAPTKNKLEAHFWNVVGVTGIIGRIPGAERVGIAFTIDVWVYYRVNTLLTPQDE